MEKLNHISSFYSSTLWYFGYFIKNHIYPNIEKNADSFIKFKNELNFSNSRPSKKSLLFINPKMKIKLELLILY